jgi:ABC-type long-subunit fatty acid transport system fused permease/ATPase subunit
MYKKYFFILIALLLLDCSLGGFIGVWREWYWNSIAQKLLYKWILYVSEFSIIALISCWISGYSQYIINLLSLKIRTDLTNKAFELQTHHKIEGGSQRIQDDCFAYPQLLLNLIMGMFRSIIMILVFLTILYIQLPWYYLLIPFGYSLVGTLIAGKIAFPLINLNYINQAVEAKFRELIKLKHNTLLEVYEEVYINNYNLFKYSKYLQYFQSFYNQITIIIPHLILFVIYFSGKITFGIFMQVAASMTEIINNLSFVINSFSDINRLLSCRKRLKELKIL